VLASTPPLPYRPPPPPPPLTTMTNIDDALGGQPQPKLSFDLAHDDAHARAARRASRRPLAHLELSWGKGGFPRLRGTRRGRAGPGQKKGPDDDDDDGRTRAWVPALARAGLAHSLALRSLGPARARGSQSEARKGRGGRTSLEDYGCCCCCWPGWPSTTSRPAAAAVERGRRRRRRLALLLLVGRARRPSPPAAAAGSARRPAAGGRGRRAPWPALRLARRRWVGCVCVVRPVLLC